MKLGTAMLAAFMFASTAAMACVEVVRPAREEFVPIVVNGRTVYERVVYPATTVCVYQPQPAPVEYVTTYDPAPAFIAGMAVAATTAYVLGSRYYRPYYYGSYHNHGHRRGHR